MRLNLSTWLVFCLLAMACCADEEQQWRQYVLVEGLTVEMPMEIKVSRQTPVEDFAIFSFQKNTNILLKIYVGNFPEFASEKGASPIEKGIINGLKIESLTIHKTDGTISREVLFHLQETSDWPQRMHCWYASLGTPDSAEADKMISSVRFKRPAGTNQGSH